MMRVMFLPLVLLLASVSVAADPRPAGEGTPHYRPVQDGYQIRSSMDLFNRPLYGGHDQDDLPERFVTLAGDQPAVLGVVTDWRKSEACLEAKCGTLMVGMSMDRDPERLAIGDGASDPFSKWFHQSRGTVTTFRNGWMEHVVRPPFQCGASVKADIEVLPLLPEAGFLYRIHLHTDQQVYLVIGFGGITDFIGRLEVPDTARRNLSPEDCKGNKITLGKNRALVESAPGVTAKTAMRIATSFPVEVSLGDPAKACIRSGPFLAGDYKGDAPMVRMHCSVGPGQTLDGFIVVLRNTDEAALDRWLAKRDPAAELKAAIGKKHEKVEVATPDRMLNLTVPPAVIASDACWHSNTFYHGPLGWHAPYLGWRTWYGPTVVGWHDRVAKASRAFAATQYWPEKRDPKPVAAALRTSFGGAFHELLDSYGVIPEVLGRGGGIFYNMQEIYLDHVLHHLEWTGDMKLADEIFPVLSRVLDWEARVLDPEGDGMYQNWLNTWISDAHSYNGGNCAQASVYNYRANRTMAAIAKKLGRDPKPFEARAEKIKKAVQDTLWLPDKGVLAEYKDTIGAKLIHPSPELATIYHSIEAGVVDPFQAYQMLRFTETDLRNESATIRGGRLVWSSNWYPQVYSCCGLYPAENLHLAWAYFRHGLAEKAEPILLAVVDAHFTSETPGAAAHCATGNGYTLGTHDFAEIPSLLLRTIVEGLFGVRFDLIESRIEIAPNFPADWEHARLKVPDIAVEYDRKGQRESLVVDSSATAQRTICMPMRGTEIERVTLDGKPCDWHVEPGLGRSDVVVKTDRVGKLTLEISHSGGPAPQVKSPLEVQIGQKLDIPVGLGILREVKVPSGFLESVSTDEHSLTGLVRKQPGWHTAFLRVEQDQWNGWIPVDVKANAKAVPPPAESPKGEFVTVDMGKHFNIALSDIHKQEYRSPRPKGYSIMMRMDGRFAWDWNQAGHLKLHVDDSRLRKCGGVFRSPSGIPFATPAKGSNAACVSIWDNFPHEMAIPLEGKGTEVAVLLVGVTSPMQSRVENGRLAVRYRDGSEESVSLVNPVNFDDWLVAATQTENETVYFSDFNHAIVSRLRLDPTKELQSLVVRGTANEVILGVLGVSVRRNK